MRRRDDADIKRRPERLRRFRRDEWQTEDGDDCAACGWNDAFDLWTDAIQAWDDAHDSDAMFIDDMDELIPDGPWCACQI